MEARITPIECEVRPGRSQSLMARLHYSWHETAHACRRSDSRRHNKKCLVRKDGLTWNVFTWMKRG